MRDRDLYSLEPLAGLQAVPDALPSIKPSFVRKDSQWLHQPFAIHGSQLIVHDVNSITFKAAPNSDLLEQAICNQWRDKGLIR
ncbi:hypothetical protein KQ305_14675 [Synechococcus sp. CS-1332]|nr:hypothetical protein [Synechococcus sp. CS-1332]